jgi:hypothetical protein
MARLELAQARERMAMPRRAWTSDCELELLRSSHELLVSRWTPPATASSRCSTPDDSMYFNIRFVEL